MKPLKKVKTESSYENKTKHLRDWCTSMCSKKEHTNNHNDCYINGMLIHSGIGCDGCPYNYSFGTSTNEFYNYISHAEGILWSKPL